MDMPPVVKFLGIHIDCHLTWEEHVNAILKRLAKTVFVVRNLVGAVSAEVLLLAYRSLFESVYSYGLLSWGHSSHTKEVFSLQRRIVRVMTGRGYRDEVRDAFVELGILTVPSMYIYVALCYCKHNIHKYSTHSENHAHDTRLKDNFRALFLRLSHSRDAVSYYATRMYNELPTRLRDLAGEDFSREIQRFLKARAFYSIEEYLKGRHS